MLLGDAPADGEPQARALGLAAAVGLEPVAGEALRQAGAIVLDAQVQPVAVAESLRGKADANGQGGPFRAGLERILKRFS